MNICCSVRLSFVLPKMSAACESVLGIMSGGMYPSANRNGSLLAPKTSVGGEAPPTGCCAALGRGREGTGGMCEVALGTVLLLVRRFSTVGETVPLVLEVRSKAFLSVVEKVLRRRGWLLSPGASAERNPHQHTADEKHCSCSPDMVKTIVLREKGRRERDARAHQLLRGTGRSPLRC